MAKAEIQSAKKLRRTRLTCAIVEVVGLAGVVSLGAVAPAAIGVLAIAKYIPQRKLEAKNTLSRLIREGYLTFTKQGSKKRVRLTEKGKVHFSAVLGEHIKRQPKKWDGKWRIISFDVPENRRLIRDHLRDYLHAMGFTQLHASTFVYPYPCDDAVLYTKAALKLGNAVRYIIAEHIENDKALVEHFKLTRPRMGIV